MEGAGGQNWTMTLRRPLAVAVLLAGCAPDPGPLPAPPPASMAVPMALPAPVAPTPLPAPVACLPGGVLNPNPRLEALRVGSAGAAPTPKQVKHVLGLTNGQKTGRLPSSPTATTIRAHAARPQDRFGQADSSVIGMATTGIA